MTPAPQGFASLSAEAACAALRAHARRRGSANGLRTSSTAHRPLRA